MYVAMLLARTLLKLEDSALNMATRSRLAAWMDAVIRALHMDFAKDTKPTVVAIINFTNHVFRQNMCQFHYSSTNKSRRVTNESITKFTTTILMTKLGTVTTNLFTAMTKSSTVMEFNIVIQQVMEFVGLGNWEQAHTFAAVCKFWRHSSLPHLYNIEKVPMDGGAERRLIVGAFLCFLQSEHFRNMQCIFIPCGKTKSFFVNDIK